MATFNHHSEILAKVANVIHLPIGDKACVNTFFK